MKRLATTFILLLFISFVVSSQTTAYDYSCGNEKAIIIWTESRKDGLIFLNTVQGDEVHKYTMTQDYNTTMWEYSNQSENTNIRVTLKNGKYQVNGVLKSKMYSKTYTTNRLPWYQNIGFNIGHSMKGKRSFKFECMRPDNLKLYEMQADSKEVIVHNGIREQQINVHLIGLLSKFFGCDYFVDLSSGHFVRYMGVHGAPGTPKTIITQRK